MVKVRFECLYCGTKWAKTYTWTREIRETCSVCGDTDLKAREEAPADQIDYYVGCPPFPESPEPFDDDGGHGYD